MKDQLVTDFDAPPVVPATFRQLGILVLDGSGSMGEMTASKVSKAQMVEQAVKELLGLLKKSRVKSNFSIAVVTFDTSATVHTPASSVKDIDDYANYNPMIGHGGGTDIGVALRCAEGVAQQFLSGSSTESVPRSVVIVVMSDGMSGGDPRTVAQESNRT